MILEITAKLLSVLLSEERWRPSQEVGQDTVPVLLATFCHQALQLAGLGIERVVAVCAHLDEQPPCAPCVNVAEHDALDPAHRVPGQAWHRVEHLDQIHLPLQNPPVVAPPPPGLPANPELHHLVLHGGDTEPPIRHLPDAVLAEVVTQQGRRQQVGEVQRGRVQLEHATRVADVPVHLPGGVDAAALETPGIETDQDPLVSRERAPAALAVVHGRDPGARMPVVDGEADGFEGEVARVRPGEQRGADVVPGAAPAMVVGHGVARRRRKEHAAVGGRVEDEEAREDRLGDLHGWLEEQEALVAVVEAEAGDVRAKSTERRGEAASSGANTGS